MEPIAITGFSFRLPGGAEDVDSLWDLLTSKRNVMREWPASRTNVSAFYSKYHRQQNIVKCKGAHFLGNGPSDNLNDEEADDKALYAFDAPFFSTTSKEAATIDPQQRLLLETTYRALENAGIPLHKIAGSKTGVWSGSMTEDYIKVITKDADHAPKTSATSVCPAMLANRLSWYFDLRGPSLTINTACSSSMVALDLACQSLRNGQSDVGIVTGSNLLLTPELSLHLSNMNFVSPSSVSRSFDSKGDGYGRGEGVAVLIVKRLSHAVRDGDVIRAVIRASGSNQDGHTPGITQPSATAQEDLIRGLYKSAGLSTDSTRYVEAHGTGTSLGDATEANCLAKIFVSPSRTQRAIASRSASQGGTEAAGTPSLYLGSIKANIGHLEGASGLAAIIKAILILERGIIPPNPLFESWNPGVNPRFRSGTGSGSLKVPTECTAWPGGLDALRRISVNSFGFGGSNSHVILDDAFHALQEFGLLEQGRHNTATGLRLETGGILQGTGRITGPEEDDNSPASMSGSYILVSPSSPTPGSSSGNSLSASVTLPNVKPKLLVWSAPDEAGLKRTIKAYTSYLQKQKSELDPKAMDKFLDRLSYTLAGRRTIMPWRSFAVLDNAATDIDEILSSSPLIRSSSSDGAVSTEITFIFTGQGAQYAGMGLELAQHYPVFRDSLDRADAEFKKLGGPEWPSIHDAQFSQPLCTALQLALVNLLTQTFKVVPGAVIGHSSGEIAAGYTVGALSFASACKVAFHRGRLTERIAARYSKDSEEAGGMMSVNLSEVQAQRYLDSDANGDVHIACVNSPSNVTLSGGSVALAHLQEKLGAEGVFARRLNTPVGYHSPAMQEIASEYLESLGDTLESGEPVAKGTLMISSVLGEKANRHTLSAGQYWVDNLVSPVRFADALQYLVQSAPRAHGLPVGCAANFLEVGPHGALRRPLLDTVTPLSAGKTIEYLSALSRFDGTTPTKTIMEVVGRLFASGQSPVQTVLAANQPTEETYLVDLPQYPFDHSSSQIHRFESRLSREWRLREGEKGSSLLGIPSVDVNPLQPTWRKVLSIEELPWIGEHIVSGVPYFPGAGSLMMALEAVKRWYGTGAGETDSKVFKGWDIKEAQFLNPIVVREGTTTEVLTHLRPLAKSNSRAEVQIFALVDGYWAECFRATIAVKLQDRVEVVTPIDGGSEERTLSKTVRQLFEDVKARCTQPVTKQAFYDWQSRHGLEYGPVFARLDGIAWDGNDGSTGQIIPLSASVRQEAESVLFAEESGVLVHPAVLDAAFQLCSTSPSGGMSKVLHTTCIPTKMRNVFFSATGWQASGDSVGSPLQVSAISKHKATGRGIESSLAIFSNDGEQLCVIKDFQLSPVSSATGTGLGSEDSKVKGGNLVTSIEWKPHLSMLSPTQMQEYCSSIRGPEPPDRSPNPQLDAFLELWAHATPSTPPKILSIGGGTDNQILATHIISLLEVAEDRNGSLAFSECVVAEVSPDDLTLAKARASQWPAERVRFEMLETATSDQKTHTEASGVGNGYQLVLVCARALETEAICGTVLQKAREVMDSNGGHLVLYEENRPSGSGLSLLSSRESSSRFLDGLLVQAGFSGVELLSNNPEGWNVAVSSVLARYKAPQLPRRPVFVVSDDDQQGVELARKLAASTRGSSPAILTLSGILDAQESESISSTDDVIFLADFESSLLVDIDEPAFLATREVIRRARHILWVTGSNSASPALSGLKDGLLRALRSEYADKRLVSLSIAQTELDTQTIAEYIAHICLASFIGNREEVEYVVNEEGLLQTGRVVEMKGLDNDLVAANEADAKEIKTEPWLPGPPLKLAVETPGSLDSLRLTDDSESYNKPLGPNEIEIEAKAWGVGFRDVFIALGQLPEEVNEIGLDCAGVVSRVGDGCSGDIRPGDRVFMYMVGVMRMWPRADQACVVKIPNGLSFGDACAAMGVCAVTAWHALATVGRLGKGDKILIHSGAGATGQSAIQVAQHLGAEVFVTVGHEVKKDILLKAYGGGESGLREDHILYSRDLSFAKGVKRLTAGYGVDVVLNSLAGDGLQASWECLAPYGRFLEIGKVDIRGNSNLPMAQFAGNCSFSAVDLRHIAVYRKDILRTILESVVDLVQQGKLRPPTPVRTYKVSQVEHAFRYLQSGKNVGRIIIEINHNTPVQKFITPSYKAWRFDPEAAYLVAGGLGGIGRSILGWMADRGARHILVPSRTGAASSEASRLVEELADRGVNISTPKCNVANAHQLVTLVKECERPIKGCINAAMALNDSTFENMSHAQWQSTVSSKVWTSWHLHQVLPKELDFFILLSSVSGVIGNPGQSNYAAGCTFQDSLAKYRQSQGWKATSIDLGAVRDVGVIAESDKLHSKLTSSLRDMRQVTPEELLNTLDLFCDPVNAPPYSQIILGLVSDNPDVEDPSFMQQPLFRNVSSRWRLHQKKGDSSSGKTLSNQALFDQATTREERLDVIRQALCKKLARALSIKPEDMDTRRPLHAFGVDSLVSVEIRNWFLKEFSADVAVFELMNGRSVEAIVELAAERVKKA
ncbi:polyketide synthase [Naviculisporaceae sp. PSN 640]